MPGLVPVAKGNGYGFTVGGLARRAQWLATSLDKTQDRAHPDERGSTIDTLAVGTYEELGEAASRFHGSLLVLTPWRPFSPQLEPGLAHRVIHTIGRPGDLSDLLARDPHARILLERRTSMLRHGFDARELREAARTLTAAPHATREGVAFHLPLGSGSHLSEVHRLMTDVVAAGLTPSTIWVSHLTGDELAQLHTTYADFSIRPRVGTALWLGARDALHVTSTVLDVHEVERGDTFGYRGRTAPKSGHIVVVSGGTAHGIGLESPTGELSLKARASTLARGGLDAVGFVRSPFTIDGKQRLFAEPPHMQASMLFLPNGPSVPLVGDEIEVRVRFTTTTFDRVTIT
jgi:Alanine racemase, N-terminal domain